MSALSRTRKRTFEVLEVYQPGDDLSRLTDIVIMTLVAGNVLAVILESVASLGLAYADLFMAFEQISVAVFSAELICRFWAAPEAKNAGPNPWRSRLRYVFSPMALCDILAIAPFFLATFVGLDLRFLRILRLFRIVKLSRYSSAMSRVGEVFIMQRSALAAAFFVLSVAIVLSASVLHVVEHTAQPEAFGSIPAAMWWAVCTLTTVGYGDVAPITSLGKLLASGITVIGIGMVALPTSLFAAGFAHVTTRNENTLREEARSALKDGVVTGDEVVSYAHLADSLYIDPDIARQIFELTRESQTNDDCPHCGKSRSD